MSRYNFQVIRLAESGSDELRALNCKSAESNCSLCFDIMAVKPAAKHLAPVSE